MYKLSINNLNAFLKALEKSNKVLKKLCETDDSPAIEGAIRENEKQITIIKEQFHIDETRN
jgi:hypothetical protein